MKPTDPPNRPLLLPQTTDPYGETGGGGGDALPLRGCGPGGRGGDDAIVSTAGRGGDRSGDT